jgi:hypothetical protein
LFNGTLKDLIYLQKVSSFYCSESSTSSETRLVICIAKHSIYLERRNWEVLTRKVTFPTSFQNLAVWEVGLINSETSSPAQYPSWDWLAFPDGRAVGFRI